MDKRTLNQETIQSLDQYISFINSYQYTMIRDALGNFLYASPQLRQLYIDNHMMKADEALIGKNIRDLYPETADDYLDHDKLVFKNNEALYVHQKSRLLNKSHSKFIMKKMPFTINEEVIGILGVSFFYNTLAFNGQEINLSIRQLQVISGTFFGLPAKEIAHQLEVSHRTIEGHLLNLKNKLCFENKSAIQRFVLEHNLIEVVHYFFYQDLNGPKQI